MNTQPRPQLLRRLLFLMLPYVRWILLAALLGLLTIASSIGLMALAAYIIAAASLQPSIADLQIAIVGVRFFGISRGVFRYLERLISHQATFRLLGHFREWFYCGLEPAAPSRLANLDSGELLSRITSDLEILEHFYLRVLAPPLIAVLTILLSSILTGIFSFHVGAALAFMMTAAMAAAAGGWLRLRSRANNVSSMRAEVKTRLIDQIQGLADLLAFNAEDRFLSMLMDRLDSVEKARCRLAAARRSQHMIMSWMRDASVLVVLILAIPQVRAGTIEGVYLGFLAMAAYASFEAIIPLPKSLQQLELSLQAAERLFQVVDLPPAVREPDESENLQPPLRLAFEHVSFQYNRDEFPVLEDITFELEPGKQIAVVGPSGCGKTTLLRLALRLWEPDSGQITLNGILLQHLNTEKVRQAFSVVTQETFLFHASIANNLKIGAVDSGLDEIRASAERAGIGSFIENLPEGYDTWLGENAANLSGGERQRLALTRAYLKPGILLLDEPTSHLDIHTEQQVLDSLLSQAPETPLLLITHRLVGMERMNEILVLNKGRIIERGTHVQLLQMGGLYYRLWQAQHEADALRFA